MAKVYDVPADLLIAVLAQTLKDEGIEQPSWAPFVKTGAHVERPPQDSEWWYTRSASIMRKIYMHGPLGINDLRREYGGGRSRPKRYGSAKHTPASGAIIRNAIHSLEELGYVKKAGSRGRILTSEGVKKMDRLATSILKRLIAENPLLKVYS